MAVTLNAPAVSMGGSSGTEGVSNDPGYDIVLLVGQSNMVGFSGGDTIDAKIDWSDDRIYQWSPTGGNENDTTYANKLLKANDPLLWPGLGNLPEWGALWGPSCGTGFARYLIPFLNPGRQLVLIPAAVGGTGLVGGDWNHVNGWLFLQAVASATEAVNSLPNARVTHIIWVQGEADNLNGNVTVEEYRVELDATLEAFRTEIPNAEDAKIIIGQMVPEYIGPYTFLKVAQIDAVHRDTPRRIDNCWFVQGPTGMANPGDTIHYSAEGQRTLGHYMGVKSQAPAFLSKGAILDKPLNVTAVGLQVHFEVPASDAPLYAIEYRPAGSTDEWSRVYFSPRTFAEVGDTVVFNFATSGVELSEDVDVRVASAFYDKVSEFSDSVLIAWDALPQAWTELDFNNATHVGGVVSSVPSIGTDSTAWIVVNDDAPTLEDLGPNKVLRTTVDNSYLKGPTLLQLPYSMFVLVKHDDFVGAGSYFVCWDQYNKHMLWRGGGSQNEVYAGHGGFGHILNGPAMDANKWYAIGLTFDPTLPSNQLKLYLNGTLVDEVDAPTTTIPYWEPGANIGLNRQNDVTGHSSGGNNAIYAKAAIWQVGLSAQLMAQIAETAASELGIVLG